MCVCWIHAVSCVLFLGLFYQSTHVDARNFKVAWLAPKKDYYNCNATTSVGGLKLALYSITKNKGLENHTVSVRWYDSDCNSKKALSAAVDARKDFDPDVFLGPPCSEGMRGVAQLASHWNLPVFGWVSNDLEFGDKNTYSTLVRLLGPLNRFPTTMKYLVRIFRWRRYAMLHDRKSPYEAVSKAIAGGQEEWNYSITSTHPVHPDMTDEEIKAIFKLVQRDARVIIFSVPWHTLRKYMLVAHDLGMADGEYAFICMHSDLYTWDVIHSDILSDRGWRRNDDRDLDARHAFEAVLHITMDMLQEEHFKDFSNYSNAAAILSEPNWQLPVGAPPDAYSVYLYDATWMWALLAMAALDEGKDPKNGTLLFQKAPNFNVKGLTGNIVMDRRADRLLNFWILDMQEDGTFKKVTEIIYNQTGASVFTYVPEEKLIRWPGEKIGVHNAPPDIPVCGFLGELCKEDHTHIIVGVAAGLSTVLAIVIAVNVVLKVYRRPQRQQDNKSPSRVTLDQSDVQILMR